VSALQTRYRAYVTLAEQAEAAQDFRGAAVEFYSAYCEHPSKWDETVYLIIDNPQYPDWHGREYGAHYQDARRFET